MEKKVIGVCWCEECRADMEITISGEGDAKGRAPQVYIEGFHLHLFGQVVPIPGVCIWVTNFDAIQAEIDNAKDAADWLRLEDTMIKLLNVRGHYC